MDWPDPVCRDINSCEVQRLKLKTYSWENHLSLVSLSCVLVQKVDLYDQKGHEETIIVLVSCVLWLFSVRGQDVLRARDLTLPIIRSWHYLYCITSLFRLCQVSMDMGLLVPHQLGLFSFQSRSFFPSLYSLMALEKDRYCLIHYSPSKMWK